MDFIQRIENILVSHSKKEMLQIVIEVKKNKIINELYEQSAFHVSDELGHNIEDSYKSVLSGLTETVFEKIQKDIDEIKRLDTLLEQYNSLPEPPVQPASEPAAESPAQPASEPAV